MQILKVPRWTGWIALLIVLLIGCARKETEQIEQTPSQPTATVGERNQYEQTAETKLAELGTRIDSLKVDLKNVGADAKGEIEEEIEQLNSQRQVAARKLDELRTAGDDRWESVKHELSQALDDLDQKYDRLRARLANRS